MKKLYFLFFLILTNGINAQKSINTAIGDNEKLTLIASYNVSGLLTNIAEVVMHTSRVTTGKNTYLRLQCNATTYSKWDSFFKIRDIYESYVNPSNLTPYLYKRDVYEGGYIKKEKYVYSYKNKTVRATMQKKKDPDTKSLPLNNNVLDIVSTLYQVRNMDIAKAPIGTSQKITVLFDRKPQESYLTLLGTEIISNNYLGSTECYKIAISDKVLQGTNANILYLSADANKIPVFIEFSIPAGKGQLKLIQASGLKNESK